jgi:hypothetical protein
MQLHRLLIPVVLLTCTALGSQETESKRKGPGPEDISTSSLISQPGPSFQVPASEIGKTPKVIVFGDQRFTDPANTKVTNPKVRRLLV